ncbi:AraC family transcriptional regulator [Kitasatospora sp. NPDC036755]|uniref:AraC family transcriptional regulator n=1 Tax=Kitasatospora sp. NPDC036755 TaxID=3154600 RepID=UPI0033FFD9D4
MATEAEPRTTGTAPRTTEAAPGTAGTAPPGAGTGPVSLYEGNSIEELRHVVGARLAPHRLTVRGEQRLPGRFRSFHEGPVALYDLGYGAPVHLSTGDLPDFYNVILPYAGGGRVVSNGTELPSALSVAGPGDRVTMEWDAEALNGALAMSRESVEEALAVRLGDLPQDQLHFTPVLDPADPAVRDWLRLADAFRAFCVSELGRRSPLGMRQFERLLVDTLLDAQPHSLSRTQPDRGRAPLPGPLRRAADYCAEHAGEALSVADIALAARVSLRTLREGFRRHLDTTPLAYLRRVRLDRAHHDLLAIADGRAHGTVTEVACRWGFTHLGRFSADYRRAYGRSPSQTLGRNS